MTNCPNCGAVIDRSADKCAYCGTPYLRTCQNEGITLKMDGQAILHALQAGVFTVNEARALIGLPRRKE